MVTQIFGGSLYLRRTRNEKYAIPSTHKPAYSDYHTQYVCLNSQESELVKNVIKREIRSLIINDSYTFEKKTQIHPDA